MSLEALLGVHPSVKKVLKELQGFTVSVTTTTALDVLEAISGMKDVDTLLAALDTGSSHDDVLADLTIHDGRAFGKLTIAAGANVGDTVTVNSLVYTAVSGTADNTEWDQSGAPAAEITSLAASINSRDSANVTAVALDTICKITAVAKGEGGNAFNLLESTSGVRIVANGATLLQGTGVKANETAQCTSVVAGDTVTIRGKLYTAVAVADVQAAKFDTFSVGVSDTECATALKDAINGRDGQALLATSSTDTVTITSTRFGTADNAITLTEVGNVVLGGATLSNGTETDGGVIPDGTLGPAVVYWYDKK